MTDRSLTFLTTSLALVVCAVAVICGCSSKVETGTISGNVSLKGEAFAECKVAIYNSETMIRRGARVNADGTYKFANIPPGDYAVMIRALPVEDDAEFLQLQKKIPKKLLKHETTDLSVTVKTDEDTEFNVELTP